MAYTYDVLKLSNRDWAFCRSGPNGEYLRLLMDENDSPYWIAFVNVRKINLLAKHCADVLNSTVVYKDIDFAALQLFVRKQKIRKWRPLVTVNESDIPDKTPAKNSTGRTEWMASMFCSPSDRGFLLSMYKREPNNYWQEYRRDQNYQLRADLLHRDHHSGYALSESPHSDVANTAYIFTNIYSNAGDVIDELSHYQPATPGQLAHFQGIITQVTKEFL